MADVRVSRTLKAFVGELLSWKSAAVLIGVTIVFAWLPDGLANLLNALLIDSTFLLGLVQFLSSIVILSFFYLLMKKFFSSKIKYRVEPVNRKFKVVVFFLSDNERSWEVPVKAVRHHLGMLEKFIIIPSPESASSSDRFKDYLLREVENPDFSVEILKPVNFMSIEEVQERVENIYNNLREEGYRERDVVIDVTGGTKNTSIGAAVATAPYPERYFQYSSGKVTVYNMSPVE